MLRTLLLLCLLLSGGIFGLFYAWACSTMLGLEASPPQVAIAAMQAMNAPVHNAVFGPNFVGTGPALLLASVLLLRQPARLSAALMAFAALVYFLGAFVPTFSINVPMNEALAALPVPAADAEARAIWAAYSARWQDWNQLRTVASGMTLLLVGAVLLALPPCRA